jgi:hypothetical protein
MSHVTQVFPTSERFAHCGSACAGPSRVASPKSQVSHMHVRMRRSFPIRVRCGRVRVDEVYDGLGGRTRLGALVRCSDRPRKNSRSGPLTVNARVSAQGQASGTRDGFVVSPAPHILQPCVACLALRRLHRVMARHNARTSTQSFDSELARAGEAGEGDRVANVGDARHVAYEALKAESIARVRHLMRSAIRGHQRPSEAIRGHQRPSEAIRGHQRPSEAIR